MKITVYTIAADTARDGSFCHAFATEAERDAWAWENIVAKNLRSDETEDGSEECIDLVKDAFPTAYDAIHTGERKGYDDSYWFYDNEIEIPSPKIKLYTVQGEHFSNPGHILKHFTDKQAATAEAVSLVNIMLSDTDWSPVATADNWMEEVITLQDYHGAQYCDVWITESEIETPAPPPAKKFILALDLNSGMQVDIYDSEVERSKAIWELAWNACDTTATTLIEFMDEYDLDYDEAMQAAEIGYVTEDF